jgi:hypothetical protein
MSARRGLFDVHRVPRLRALELHRRHDPPIYASGVIPEHWPRRENTTRYGLGVRITAIEPLARLSPEEADLLRGLLEWEDPDIPDIDPATLVVYVVTTPKRGNEKVIAPASEALGVGMTVIASAFTATAKSSSKDAGEEPMVSVASALVPHDHDI